MALIAVEFVFIRVQTELTRARTEHNDSSMSVKQRNTVENAGHE